MPDVPISTHRHTRTPPCAGFGLPLEYWKRDSFITQNSGLRLPSGILVVHGTPPSGPGSGPGWLHHYGLAAYPGQEGKRLRRRPDHPPVGGAGASLPGRHVQTPARYGQKRILGPVLLLPFGLGRLFFFYLTLSESKTENNKYRGTLPYRHPRRRNRNRPPSRSRPFYLYWLISLRKLTTTEGRASRAEFWSFFLLSLFLFLPLGTTWWTTTAQSCIRIFSPSREILLYITQPQDALILLAHACFNPTFYFFYQSGDLSTLSWNC